MGLGRWIKSVLNPNRAAILSQTPPPIVTINVEAWLHEGRGTFRTQIHGESYRQPEIREGLAGRRPWAELCTFTVMLRPEENPHDRNAVGVYRVGGKQIGFLTRDAASRWRPALDRMLQMCGVHVACNAVVKCAGEGRPMGVWLDVELRDVKKELAERLASGVETNSAGTPS